jgi:hypothetical protein
MTNVTALSRVATFLRANPAYHNQHQYYCGTNACVAGWAVALDMGLGAGEHIGARLRTLGEHRVSAKASDLLGLTQAEADVLFIGTSSLDPEDAAVLLGDDADADNTEGAALAVIDALIDRDTTGPLSAGNTAILGHYGLSTVLAAGPVTTGGTA